MLYIFIYLYITDLLGAHSPYLEAYTNIVRRVKRGDISPLPSKSTRSLRTGASLEMFYNYGMGSLVLLFGETWRSHWLLPHPVQKPDNLK